VLNNIVTLLRASALVAGALTLGACDWFTDFKQQPSVHTWGEFSADSGELKGFRGQPAGSVGTNGTLISIYQVSNSPMPGTIDSMSFLPNPATPDDRSLLNGRKYFQINCAVCHGEAGDGNGALKQLNPAYGFPPSLLTESAKGRTDGYIWGMIRNGRGLMPPYNRIEETDRWDVVNYIRGLQGKFPVMVGPVGRPGETGDKLPGVTRLGPTVPVKYFHPVVVEHAGSRKPEAGATKAETKPEIKP
jgi:mono/diheme cytochrome c family protein